MSHRLSPATTDLVVLCGGRGIRLGSLTTDTPKPLLPVGDRPFLAHLLLRMKQEGFTRVILAAHYLAAQFKAFITGHRQLIPDVQLVVEPQPFGTGGALRYAADHVRTPTFVALNGDTWIAQPLAPVLQAHERSGWSCTSVVTAASQVEGGAIQKGVWEVKVDQASLGFTTQACVSSGWINAGMYVLDSSMVRSWPQGSYSLEGQFPSLLNGRKAGVFYSSSRLFDIGTPEVYEQANRLLASTQEASECLRK